MSTLISTGTLANRPDPNPLQINRLYWAEDTNEMYRDLGTSWDLLIGSDLDAALPSLRSLGQGAEQGSAGDHFHDYRQLKVVLQPVLVIGEEEHQKKVITKPPQVIGEEEHLAKTIDQPTFDMTSP